MIHLKMPKTKSYGFWTDLKKSECDWENMVNYKLGCKVY